ncbi:hypothetical protein BUALT_Bualt13G0100300 [Buddleja alternifolia]|uniref:Cystatin domain-containing protein n=1 Tax=Buddleja alternifolia TaxID=168488 RepID=A0AAV6WLY4_9LAMI|nr:hypothetical protein BUALT_Bualt13G0100300 [Buddleja alternifolia]
MASKYLSLLLVFLSILACSFSYEVFANSYPFRPINNKDPQAVKLGKFAVTEHNKRANTTLEFVSLVKGEYAATILTYELVIDAKNGTAATPESYKAIVHLEKLRGVAQTVLYFEKL